MQTNRTGNEYALDSKSKWLLLLPFILTISCILVFKLAAACLGNKFGYLAGFIFYWSLWCLTVPLSLIGNRSIVAFFKIHKPIFGKHKIINILFLVLPLIFVYSYEFSKALKDTNTTILVASAGLSVINATAEEILWRGTFLKLMGANSKWYILFSSAGFAIWHFAPLTIFPNHNPGGFFSFVSVAFILGLLFSCVVKDTRSILLTTASHILFDFSGLGARIYFN